MRREDKFVLSHRPYAVDLSSLRLRMDPAIHSTWEDWWMVDAVWFRRRKGVTVACVGFLDDLQHTAPKDAAEFLAAHDNGTYGGDCLGRWDGTRYWGATQDPDANMQYLALLRRLLADFQTSPNDPPLPATYSGWWRF
jgi:hypothetical protein